MLKIKVLITIRTHFFCIDAHTIQGMSEAKVEKIKEAAQKIAVRWFGIRLWSLKLTEVLVRGHRSPLE